MFKGELISLLVAAMWTSCAMFAEVASKRMGSLPFNVTRMVLSLLLLGGVLWWWTGSPLPPATDSQVWLWLSLSGLVGYVLGDFCLFNGYILIGSRRGQLLMTLAPPFAALFGFILLGQKMSLLALLGMVITISGIATAIYRPGSRDNGAKVPFKGILFGIGAAIGQGVGLVLSAKGLLHYEQIVAERGVSFAHGSASLVLPFAATSIRAITGLVGFTLWTILAGEAGKLKTGFMDRKAMLCSLGATVTGPFIGVSLSLMATMYTSTGIAQTIMALTPVLIILPTYLIFHQKVHWREILGAIISVCGVALFFI